MQRRVAVARAIAYCDQLYADSKSPVLLLDEAIKELDSETAKRTLSYITEFCERTNCTVITVTHDIEEARTFCHSIIEM